jgi:hypothetical protein
MDDWFAKDPIVGTVPAQAEWWSADPIVKQKRTLGGAAREAVTNLPGGIAKTAMGVLDIAAGVPRTVAKAVLPEKLFSAIDTSVGDASAGERASEAARTALYDLPVGLAVKAGKSAMGIPAMRSEGALDRPIAVANAFIDSYKAYGNEQEFLEKLATQPESILGDLSLGLGLSAKAAPIGQIADALKKASVITDPLMGPVAAATRTGTAVMNAADLLRPERTVANKLISLSETPEQIPNAMRATQGVESAVPLTTAERLAEAGIRNPEIAGLERNLVDTSTRTGRAAFAQQEQRVAQLQDQLAQVDAQLQAQTNAMAPAQNVEANVARDRLARTLEQEQASLAQQQAAAAAALPTANQADVGAELAGQIRARKKELQTTEIEPAKQAAIQAAGPSRVDLTSVFQTAEDILGQPLTTLKPDTAPEITRILQRFAPTERPGEFIPLGYGGGYTAPPKPPGSPMATLNDIDALGKALNMDIKAAASSTTGAASQRLGKLYELHGALDEAIAGSALPQAAKDQWAGYRELNRQYVKEIKTGETAKIFETTPQNEPKLRPDDTVDAFAADVTSARQFVTSYGKVPGSVATMREGLIGRFRDAVVDPVTQTIKPDAVAKFKETYAKQIDIFDSAGMNIKSALEKTYADVRRVERGMNNVKDASKKFGEFETGAALIDSTLKSPKDMDALRRLVGSDGREAISQHLTSRALELLKAGDAPSAIKYLTDNEAAIKASLTKPKAFTELLENAQLQKNLADVKATAPETSAKLVARLEPSELKSLAVIARDIQRMKEVDALAAQSSAARGAAPGRGGKLVSEAAGELGLPPIDPTYMNRAYTTARAIVRKLATKLNTRTTAVLTDRMLTNPDKLIADIEAQVARNKGRAEIRKITPPLGLSSAVNALAPANQNAMRPE